MCVDKSKKGAVLFALMAFFNDAERTKDLFDGFEDGLEGRLPVADMPLIWKDGYLANYAKGVWRRLKGEVPIPLDFQVDFRTGYDDAFRGAPALPDASEGYANGFDLVMRSRQPKYKHCAD